MPRTGLPLTPGSSSDIKGKDGTQQLASFQLSFELPPPAINDSMSRVSPPDSQVSPLSTRSSTAIIFPTQPAETVKARRRSSAAKPAGQNANTFALPPPPTRSRKIIQMKPRTQSEASNASAKKTSKGTSEGAASSKSAPKTTVSNEQGKKKANAATSAATKKNARRTAHSLIERRRRCKMNEQFATLKDMIPACEQDMHKLSILSAAIDYIRYLKECVDTLQTQQGEYREWMESQTQLDAQAAAMRPSLPSIRDFHPSFQGVSDEAMAAEGNEDDNAPDQDVEMSGSDNDIAVSPTLTGNADPKRYVSISPALQPEHYRHDSYSSVGTDRRHFSFSAGASPAFGPQRTRGYTPSEASAPSLSMLTSPALGAQNEGDQEAMTALMMLTHDRRDKGVNEGGTRLLSVKDLLSH